MSEETNYLDMLKDVMDRGVLKKNRTGVDTKSLFGYQIRFDLTKGFPLLTTKKMHLKSIIHELLWFLKGDTNVKYLQDNNVKIWNEWANKDGELVNCYGKQWRRFGLSDSKEGIDQISWVVNEIKKNPFSRRLVVSAWNPQDLEEVSLAWCHALFQFNVRPDENGNPKYLDCHLYQRSADIFLGVPFNIASYALLTMMVAHVCDLTPGDFVHSFGDLHLYTNHVEQSVLQTSRIPYDFPTMKINKDVKNIFDFKYEDFVLENYVCHPSIKGEVAV